MGHYFSTLAVAGTLASVAACGGSQQEVTPTTVVDGQPRVVIESNLAFATYEDLTLTLDLHLPADPAGAPIQIEGPREMAQEGAIVVVIQQGVPDPPDSPDGDDEGMRFLGDHGAHIRAEGEAGACAIRFARARASELGSDDPIVVVAGFSQPGGVAAHVALFGAALDERWDEFAAKVGGPPRQVECTVPDGSTHVDALVANAGTYDLYVPVIEGLYGRTYQQERDPDLQQFLASAVGINPELTVRLTHGTADSAIPVTVSADFEAALADAGYDVQLTTFDGDHENPPTELSLEIFREVLGL